VQNCWEGKKTGSLSLPQPAKNKRERKKKMRKMRKKDCLILFLTSLNASFTFLSHPYTLP